MVRRWTCLFWEEGHHLVHYISNQSYLIRGSIIVYEYVYFPGFRLCDSQECSLHLMSLW